MSGRSMVFSNRRGIIAAVAASAATRMNHLKRNKRVGAAWLISAGIRRAGSDAQR